MKEKHGTLYCPQRLGAVRWYPIFRTIVTLCAATERNAGFVKSLNTCPLFCSFCYLR